MNVKFEQECGGNPHLSG